MIEESLSLIEQDVTTISPKICLQWDMRQIVEILLSSIISFSAMGKFLNPYMTFANNLNQDEAPQYMKPSENLNCLTLRLFISKILDGNNDYFEREKMK